MATITNRYNSPYGGFTDVTFTGQGGKLTVSAKHSTTGKTFGYEMPGVELTEDVAEILGEEAVLECGAPEVPSLPPADQEQETPA